jgi:hypothetical protein
VVRNSINRREIRGQYLPAGATGVEPKGVRGLKGRVTFSGPVRPLQVAMNPKPERAVRLTGDGADCSK